MTNAPLAWIVGGSRGIGFACAEALHREGYRIAISGRDSEMLTASAAKIDRSILAVVCDVTSEGSVQAAYRTIVDRFGAAPDVLLNSAGISPWDTFSETSIDTFDAVLATNMRGLFLTAREVLRDMFARGSGTIVHMLSVAALKGYKNGAAYVASKFAALGFTNALREEARTHGVSVISIFPGATETELWDETERTQYHDRMMQPEDIAHAIVSALREPKRAVMEEIVLRPIQGDL